MDFQQFMQIMAQREQAMRGGNVRGPASQWPRVMGPASAFPRQGPTSVWPQRALPSGPLGLPSGSGGALANTIQQGSQRTLPTGTIGLPSGAAGVADDVAALGQARPFSAAQQAAVNRVLASGGAASMPAASLPAAAIPTVESIGAAAASPGARTAAAAGEGLIGAARAASPITSMTGAQAAAGGGFRTIAPAMWQAGNAGATLGPAAPQGLLRAGLSRLGAVPGAIKAGGFRGALGPGLMAAGGSIGGNMLDESQLLGGEDSKLNDTASKVLKWGGTGAAIGSVVPGVGTLLGAGIGGVIGVAHEGLERQGILGTRGQLINEANTLVNESTASAAEIGLPAEVTSLLQKQYNAGLEFAKTDEEKLALAQNYAAQVQEHAMNYAADPGQYQTAEQSNEDMMIARSMMMSAVKPYANNFLAQSSAEADMYQGMANEGGDMAPMYEQMAANTRARGARQAMETVQEAQVTPYTEALKKQAGYLNQMSNSLVSQAMGQVMQPQAAAGSVDLTALIDGAANQMQPQ
jgi:hypothetical protein